LPGLVMAVLLSWAGCALAGDAVPDLTETWKGTTQSIISGPSRHFKPITKPTFASVKITIRIKRQKGRVFYGIVRSNRASEQVVGVIGPDKTISLADEDGYRAGSFITRNKLELVYLEAGQQSQVANSTIYRRVR
jgi:hypothetical protein